MAVGSKDIEAWIRGQIVKTNKKVGKAICPAAARVIKKHSYQITMAQDDVLAQIDQCCGLFGVFGFDIVIIYFNKRVSEKRLSNICQQAHENNPRFAVMYDHPSNDGKHKGVSFSFGKAPLIMIQDLEQLKKFQKIYQQQGWYDAWGIKDYDQFY